MASSIKEILDLLPDEQRKALMVAFELGVTQFIITPDGRYIGVNLPEDSPNLDKPDCKAGKWSSGDYIP